MDLVARGLLGDTLRRDAERFGVACFAIPPSMSTMEQSEGLAWHRGGVVVIRSQRAIVAVALNRRMELELLLYAVRPVEPLSDKISRFGRLEIYYQSAAAANSSERLCCRSEGLGYFHDNVRINPSFLGYPSRQAHRMDFDCANLTRNVIDRVYFLGR